MEITVKEHYDNHLGDFYSWMMGDFEIKKNEFLEFCRINDLIPFDSSKAIDLGAGSGIQSVALAELGFNVVAIDFNKQLLSELNKRIKGLQVEVINSDFKDFKKYVKQAELIICCGDTISHLKTKDEISALISDIYNSLIPNGKCMFSFRDYSTELKDRSRFIPVKSDANRILSCFLEYFPERVRVTDLLYEKINDKWEQKTSSYYKVRISDLFILEQLSNCGFEIVLNEMKNRMFSVIGIKKV